MQRRLFAVVAALLVCAFATSSAIAYRYKIDANGNGVVRSHKTGALARVGAQFAPKFQAYIDDIEARGGIVRKMGGMRRGHCSARHMHSCGRALDVCQTRRDRVDPRCRLPDRHELARIAAAHGLFEGGQWCHGDYGHAQAGVSAPACGSRPRQRHIDPPIATTLVASAKKRRGVQVYADPMFPDRLTASY
jgi:hypothetical protein